MKLTNIILLLVGIAVISSCFEISGDVLFEDFEEQVVIEANLNNIDSQCVVKISRTVHPDSQQMENPVNDAQVILSGNSGESELLIRVQPGMYVSNNIKGKPLEEYSLRVYCNNENYNAIETMDEPGAVHRVELLYLDEHVKTEGYYVKLYIEKELNKTKYYKLDVIHNDSLFGGYSDLLLINDAYVTDVLEYLVPYVFQEGDSVNIYLHTITASMNKYYYELNKQSSNAFSNIQPPLINPPSNFTNHALGYFQVSAVTPISIVIR